MEPSVPCSILCKVNNINSVALTPCNAVIDDDDVVILEAFEQFDVLAFMLLLSMFSNAHAVLKRLVIRFKQDAEVLCSAFNRTRRF